jgi:esterase
MQLYFQKFGAGFPLIILHGLFGSSDNWQPVARKLGEHFQIFAVDLRNHGRSPHDDAFNYEVMAGDLHEFMQTHSLEKIHLLGHSIGGKTAMHFALAHPGLLEKLIVVDIAPRAYPPLHTAIFDALLPLDLTRFQTRDEISRALAPSIPDPAVRQFLLKNIGRDESGAFRWKMNLPVIHRNYDSLNGPIQTNSTFAKPTLFIRGSQSDYILDSDHEMIIRVFPVAKIVTIPNAGHWVHADAPEEFLNTLSAFIR